MTRVCRRAVVPVLLIAVLAMMPRPAAAFSVLSHEATVDAAWDSVIVPILKQKYPQTPADALQHARAYAYGGALIQDLGYYPFGSKFFSNLLHYVRSGDFVEALIRNAQDVNEYAFALGALAHYTSDNMGHPIAVNRVVPMMYPKLRAKFGDEMLYADSPARHVMIEFAFDVSQVARGDYEAQAYRDLIGFEVAKPVLERAFLETYGLELKDLFFDVDLAIGTYRRAVSTTIPELTRLAWRDKRDEILARTPGIEESRFRFTMSRAEFEQAHGSKYRKPSLLSRFFLLIYKVMPKVGPLRPLSFEPVTPEADALFVESLAASRARYIGFLQQLQAGRLSLADSDLDTGKPQVHGANPLAEETYLDLMEMHAKHDFAGMPPELRAQIVGHYRSAPTTHTADRKNHKREVKAAKLLAAMQATA